MIKTIGRVCAASAVALALAGCVPEFLRINLFSQKSTEKGDRIVSGSLDAVTKSAHGALTTLGVRVVETRDAGEVRLAGMVGQTHFCMVLMSEKSLRGEQTRIRIEWDDARDDHFLPQVLSLIEMERGT
jgi:hypothetical protein